LLWPALLRSPAKATPSTLAAVGKAAAQALSVLCILDAAQAILHLGDVLLDALFDALLHRGKVWPVARSGSGLPIARHRVGQDRTRSEDASQHKPANDRFSFHWCSPMIGLDTVHMPSVGLARHEWRAISVNGRYPVRLTRADAVPGLPRSPALADESASNGKSWRNLRKSCTDPNCGVSIHLENQNGRLI
jgi:hypothetical protein